MKRWRLKLLSVLLAGLPLASSAAAPKADNPAAGLSAQQFYQYLLGEMAWTRGQIPIASAAISDLARQTQDPAVAKRAAELALAAKQYADALAATRIWLEHEPESPQANQMMVALLAATGHMEELRDHLSKVMQKDAASSPELLLRLNRLFARVADKAETYRLVTEITAPHLALPEAHMARAQAAYASEQNDAALTALNRAIELRPDWESAILFKALLLQKQPAEVVALLEPFVRRLPQAVDARLMLARALVAVKRYADARAEFERVDKEQPGNLDVKYALGLLAMQLNDTVKAEPILRELIEAGHPESNLLRTYLAQLAEDKHAPLEAADLYRQVGPGPQQAAAHARAVQLLAKAGRTDEARALIQNLPASTPTELAQRVIAEAHLLREANRHEDAWHTLESGLAKLPQQPELLYETALAAEKLGHHERMESLLHQLMRAQPDNAHAYNALGYSLAERGIRLEEAQQLIDKALSLAPEDPFILDSKGWVLYRRGDREAALAILQKAYTKRTDPEIAAHMGEVLWMLGRQDEARKLWTDSRHANPGNEVLADTIKKFLP